MIVKPISDEEIRNLQIQGNLPNRPTQKSLYPDNTLTAEEVKAAFDRLPKFLAEKLNEVIRRTNEESSLLPTITAEDNDKVLTAQNGKWILKQVLTKEEVPYFFIGKSGKIENDAIYQKILKDKLTLFYVTEGDSLVLLTPSALQGDGKIFLLKGMLLSKEEPIATLYQITLLPDKSWTLSEYSLSREESASGIDGKSAYEIACEYGFDGSEEEWLASLKANCEILENISSADNGKVLGVENGNAAWVKPDECPLPSITSEDDGKIVSAENGKWVVKAIEAVGGIRAGFVTIRGGSEGTMTEDNYALLSNRENYIEYIVEESTNSSRIYDCHLAENTKTRKTYVSRTFTDANGNAAYILIHVYSNRTWYKTETSYSCFLEPTEADNGKVLEVVNGNPVWTEKGSTSAARQYVTLRGGSEGVFGEDELSILRNDENGIEYVIEESTNSSRIYRCHLSENTKTRKTYVSHTFTGQNGSASYILIQVELSGAWYKTERTYKGFLSPTAADSGKVLTVHANGTPIWSDPVNSYTLTPTDKAEIAEMVGGATIVQAPKYVNSVSEMTDTNRLYVLKSTGRIYAYMNTTTEQEVTVRDDIVSTADNGYIDGNRFGSSTASDSFSSDAAGYHLTPLIDLTKAEYQGKTIQLHLEGCQYVSTGAYAQWIQSRSYGLDKTVLEARPYTCDTNLSGSGLIDTKNGTISVKYNSETSATLTITVPPTYGSAKVKIGYMRFCGKGAVANSRIYITYQGMQTVTGSQWVDTGTIYAPVLSNEDKQDIINQVIESIDTELLSVVGSGDV